MNIAIFFAILVILKPEHLKITIQILNKNYQNKPVLEVAGDNIISLNELLKGYPYCYWYHATGTWIIPAKQFDFTHFVTYIKPYAYVMMGELSTSEPLRIKKIWHNGTYQIGLYFGFDESMKAKAKNIGAVWSKTHKCWYLLYNTLNYK